LFDEDLRSCPNCSEMIKRRMNCEGERESRYPVYEFEGQKFYSCPRKFIAPESGQIFALYRHYQAGYLLGPGALGDQSALYCTYMDIVAGAFGREESARLEEHRKDVERKKTVSAHVQRIKR
jgi:hypothetical protein